LNSVGKWLEGIGGREGSRLVAASWLGQQLSGSRTGGKGSTWVEREEEEIE